MLKLAELREPPIVGRFYLVPVVPYIYCGKEGDWPVLGPMHTDVEHFNFPYRHYHVDPRFLTERQVLQVTEYYRPFRHSLAAVVGGSPLNNRGRPLPKGRPTLKRRRCRSAETQYVHGNELPVINLRATFSDPAEPIRKPDGRLLCPHRKVDLSSFERDEGGIVTCPLHGLRVKCA